MDANRDGSALAGPFADPAVASTYEDWYDSPWGRLADAVETELILELLGLDGTGRGPASVLDVGCGSGHFARRVAVESPWVAGVDASRAMLAAARRQPRVPVAQADALRLPFRDGSFDAVLCVALLEFCARPAELLAELARVSRGRIALLTLNPRSYLGLRRRAAGWKGHPIFRRVRPHTRAAVRRAAGEAGLRVERERGVLYLPPVLGGRLPGLERRLASGSLAAGVSGYALVR